MNNVDRDEAVVVRCVYCGEIMGRDGDADLVCVACNAAVICGGEQPFKSEISLDESLEIMTLIEIEVAIYEAKEAYQIAHSKYTEQIAACVAELKRREN